MLALYNGSDTVRDVSRPVQAESYCHIRGEAKPEITDGQLSVKMPPRSLLLLAENDGKRRGYMKNGILYLTPVAGGALQCEEDAIMAQYLFYDGKPELMGIYRNGDILLDGEGAVRFFRWNKMQPVDE